MECTKFCQNRLFCCGDIAIFRIFKMAASAILDFCNLKILLVIGVEKVETHQHAKFRQNRSIGCEDIKIFRFFFQDGGSLPSWIRLGHIWTTTVSTCGSLSLCKIWLRTMQYFFLICTFQYLIDAFVDCERATEHAKSS